MENWIDIFALSQINSGILKVPFGKKTIRIVIKNYIDFKKIRLTLSNAYGKKDVLIDSIKVAKCDCEGKLLSDSYALQVNCENEFFIDSKCRVVTDELDFKMGKGYLSISFHFKSKANINSLNVLREDVIISSKGDFVDNKEISKTRFLVSNVIRNTFEETGMKKCDIIPLLESITVLSNSEFGAIMAFGDSITQGGKWTYELAEKLNSPVLNCGIAGNKLLNDSNLTVAKDLFGKAGVSRFESDLSKRFGVKAIIFLIGINDINTYGEAGLKEFVTSEKLIDAFTKIIKIAYLYDCKCFVATLTPFKGHKAKFNKSAEKVRQDLNSWIRNTKIIDGYFDFEKMIRDKNDNEKLAENYQLGDYLHPSDQGSVEMLNSINLENLKKCTKITFN